MKFSKLSWSLVPRLPQLIIAFGIAVRLVQYLSNRSLWADEAVLALNIVNRSYSELGQPLDYDQAAPVGFLWLEKLAIEILGNNEYALRLFPLISGIISIFIFTKIASWYLNRQGKLIALVLFTSLSYLVYYASEVKQYSSDVTIALFLFILLFPLRNQQLSRLETILISLTVALLLWLSHPAILILGAMGIVEITILFLKKSQQKYFLQKIRQKIIIYLTGLSSFAICYFFFIQPASDNPNLQDSWGSAFPDSFFDLIWFLDSLGKFFHKPLGFDTILDGIAIIFFLIGCTAYFRQDKLKLFCLLSPLLITLIAAILHLYPFRSRLVLFLTPFFIITIAQGAISLMEWAKLTQKQHRTKVILTKLLTIILIAFPFLEAGEKLFKPQRKEEIKEVLQYLKVNQQPGDLLYVYQRGIYQFQYYAAKYGYDAADYIIGIDDLDHIYGKGLSEPEWQRYKADLDNLKGNSRVWLLFSHANVGSENRAIKEYLDNIGVKQDAFTTKGSFVYLYNLK
jgi:4-amino-4-deoxy-L-arabinose transferase-like glycosyltransferase